MFHTVDTQILDATVQHSVTQVTWHPALVNPCLSVFSNLTNRPNHLIHHLLTCPIFPATPSIPFSSPLMYMVNIQSKEVNVTPIFYSFSHELHITVVG